MIRSLQLRPAGSNHANKNDAKAALKITFQIYDYESYTPCTLRLYRLHIAKKVGAKIRMKKSLLIVICSLFLLFGCEDTNIELATQAGLDALKAVTLSDKDVKMLAVRAASQSDQKNQVAGDSNPYGRRLKKLVGNGFQSDGYVFNFKVYLSNQVNAFAMADGTIRIYSGLMDMMNDEELLFVVGHEMGHVVKKHIKKKIMLAYAASAVRKGVASQESVVGDIARSGIGGLLQILLNAQFSQEEERQADDFGLFYLKQNKINPSSAVSALEKLATLGKGHSFLSSHPDPEFRAERIKKQVNDPESINEIGMFEKLINYVLDFFK